MSDIKKTFHEIALISSLFKGRHDWYFCFLKAEKIAHVLALLSEKITQQNPGWFTRLVDTAAELPGEVAHFAAGEVGTEMLLADIFTLISSVRMSGTRGFISKENALYIAGEYEHMAEKLSEGNQLSPFLSSHDFTVPEFLERPQASEALPLHRIPESRPTPKIAAQSSHKTSRTGISDKRQNEQGAQGRSAVILDYVLKNKGVSIKDISAIVPNCSEKTVQRELASLISQGRIKREGERRWSVYKPA